MLALDVRHDPGPPLRSDEPRARYHADAMSGTRLAHKDPFAKVLVQVRNLIERLRTTLGATTNRRAEESEPEYLFMSTWGTLAIQGDDTHPYRACRDALIGLHGNNSERRLISRRTVEKLLTDTLLRTLRPGSLGYSDPRPKFERRMKAELRRLRRELSVPSRRWHLAAEVTGLTNKMLPMTLGRVRFVRGSKKTAAQIAANIVDLQPGSPKIALKKRLAENAIRQESRDKVTKMFSENAVAFAEVSAVDSRAAKQLGLSEVRRTIDVLNFFARYFEYPVGVHRAYLAPESRGAKLKWAVYDPSTWAITYNDEDSDEWAIVKLKPNSRRGHQIGLNRMHQLLACETRSDLEDRIVTAVGWAGRARTEMRREESFLLYAIALEALLTRPNARSGVTDRLRLRVAHLIHRRADSRKILVKTMDRLYDIRSALVHAGTSNELADNDLVIIDRIVELALLTMLTRKPFKQMKNAAAFEQWFDDRILGVQR